MTTLDTIDNKISQVKKHLQRAGEFLHYSRPEIEQDQMVRDALERVLFLVAQASIDLGEMLIAYKKLRKPSNQGEIFEILQEQKLIPRALMEKLVKMAGFRNVIAHDYVRINYDRVFQVLHENLADIKEFLVCAAKVD